MTCRAPTSATTCTGSSPTGQGLTYDHEGQLVGWTSAPHGQPMPNLAVFACDSEGSRVAMQTTNGALGQTTTIRRRAACGLTLRGWAGYSEEHAPAGRLWRIGYLGSQEPEQV